MLKWFKRIFKDKYRNWSADIALRYLPIVKAIEEDKLSKKFVLEVGSGSLGITPYLRTKITGVDKKFDGPQTNMLVKVYASAEKLPFKNNSFDYVICVDTLEHIKPNLRKKVVNELFRVGRRKIFLAVPCGDGAIKDDLYADRLFLRIMGYRDPFLKEHVENGLPNKREILELLGNDKKITVLRNVNLLIHRYIIKTQISKKRIFNLISGVINIILLPILSRINCGSCYRHIFIVEKYTR